MKSQYGNSMLNQPLWCSVSWSKYPWEGATQGFKVIKTAWLRGLLLCGATHPIFKALKLLKPKVFALTKHSKDAMIPASMAIVETSWSGGCSNHCVNTIFETTRFPSWPQFTYKHLSKLSLRHPSLGGGREFNRFISFVLKATISMSMRCSVVKIFC